MPSQFGIFMLQSLFWELILMKIIVTQVLIDFWTKVPGCKSALQAWYTEAKTASWATPTEVKAKYGNASILKGGRVVLNICGNKYRMVVQINYEIHAIIIRFIGTHGEYDQIDAQSI
jgi:mRNA interferase HigB